jgi:hypothetical protein
MSPERTSGTRTGDGKRTLHEFSLRSFALVVTDIRLSGCFGM